MKISDVITIANNTHWTKINNFFVEIFPKSDKFAKKCQWKGTPEFMNKLNTALISCTTPQYVNSNVEAYTGYQWRYTMGRDEIYRFSMTFRDFNQMELYETFRAMYTRGRSEYFDTISLIVIIWLDSDHDVSQSPIFESDGVIIESVSELNFNHNTENQIAEFTVNFKTDVVSSLR